MAEIKQVDADPSPNAVARQNVHKVREAVKNIQSREVELPISPVPKPRRISPAPSPAQSRKPLSPAPERVRMQGVQVTPPLSPMRRRSEGFKAASIEERPKPPVRKRRKKFVADGDDGENKAGSNRNSAEVNRHSIDAGDYVNLSVSEGNIDFLKETVTVGSAVSKPEEEEEERNMLEGEGEGEKREGDGTCEGGEGEGEKREGEGVRCEGERERFESFVMVEEGEETRLSVPTSPDVASLPGEEGEGPGVRGGEVTVGGCEDGRPTSTSQSSSSSSSHSVASPEVDPSPTTGFSPSETPSPIAEAVAEGESHAHQPHPRLGLIGSSSLHLSGKKRPPPLPSPYQARPPPVPHKQRSLMMRRQLTDSVVTEMTGSVSTATDSVVTVTTAAGPTIPRQMSLGNSASLHPPKAPPPRPPSPQKTRKSSPNVAALPGDRHTLSPAPPTTERSEINPLTPGNSVEVRVLTSRPETMPKHLSYGSSDSLELSEGGHSISSESHSVCVWVRVCVLLRIHVQWNLSTHTHTHTHTKFIHTHWCVCLVYPFGSQLFSLARIWEIAIFSDKTCFSIHNPTIPCSFIYIQLKFRTIVSACY